MITEFSDKHSGVYDAYGQPLGMNIHLTFVNPTEEEYKIVNELRELYIAQLKNSVREDT